MDARIIPAVQAATTDPRYQATMYYACGAESGCMAVVQQGGGPGRGPWQMETTWEPEARAMNPFTAALDFFQKWPVKQCADEQGALWATNPVQAAYTAARCAESNRSGLGSPYNASQRQAGEAAMAQGLAANTAAGGPCDGLPPVLKQACLLAHVPGNVAGEVRGLPGEVAGGVTSGVTGAAKAILSPIFDLIGNHGFWIRVLLVVGGLGAIVIGLSGLTHIEAMPVPVPV